jgi:peptide deformylase
MKIITDQNILRQVSKDTNQYEIDRLELVKKIQEANKTAWTKGAGLAAIQIGIPLRFAWYKFENKEGILLNPIITKSFGEDIKDEGCLSIPNKYTKVKRAWSIEYITNGKKKKASGFLARLIQHEIDHMNGILNIDKLITLSNSAEKDK